jgi:hypothetical protein
LVPRAGYSGAGKLALAQHGSAVRANGVYSMEFTVYVAHKNGTARVELELAHLARPYLRSAAENYVVHKRVQAVFVMGRVKMVLAKCRPTIRNLRQQLA